MNYFSETLVQAAGDGPSLSGSAAATSILDPSWIPTIRPEFWGQGLGKKLRIKGWGRLSNIVTTPGTLTLDVRIGPARPAAIICFNGAAMQLSTTAHTTLPFDFEINLRTTALGSGTTAKIKGLLKILGQQFSISGADPTTGHSLLLAPNVTPVDGTGFDSTVNNYLDLFATFSISNAGNLLQLHDYELVAVNN